MLSDRIASWAKAIAAVLGVVVALIATTGAVNQAVLDYIGSHFATKADLGRVEVKVDEILQRMENRGPKHH